MSGKHIGLQSDTVQNIFWLFYIVLTTFTFCLRGSDHDFELLHRTILPDRDLNSEPFPYEPTNLFASAKPSTLFRTRFQFYLFRMKVFSCNAPGCTSTFKTLVEFEMHYNGCHNFTCLECKKNRPTERLLDIHIEETHDSYFQVAAEKKSMVRIIKLEIIHQ